MDIRQVVTSVCGICGAGGKVRLTVFSGEARAKIVANRAGRLVPRDGVEEGDEANGLATVKDSFASTQAWSIVV